jgi:hypothetical protein
MSLVPKKMQAGRGFFPVERWIVNPFTPFCTFPKVQVTPPVIREQQRAWSPLRMQSDGFQNTCLAVSPANTSSRRTGSSAAFLTYDFCVWLAF